MKRIVFTLSMLTLILWQNIGFASPAHWSENDHWYELVPILTSWTDARTTARSQVFDNKNGYLAVISSRAEFDFVLSYYNSVDYWIGGFQLDGSTEPTGGFVWITEEPFDWTEENLSDNSGGQSVLYFNPGSHSSDPDGTAGYWDDDYATGSLRWYLVEYGTYIDDGIDNFDNDDSGSIPEPLTCLLTGIGIAAMALKKRKA